MFSKKIILTFVYQIRCHWIHCFYRSYPTNPARSESGQNRDIFLVSKSKESIFRCFESPTAGLLGQSAASSLWSYWKPSSSLLSFHSGLSDSQTTLHVMLRAVLHGPGSIVHVFLFNLSLFSLSIFCIGWVCLLPFVLADPFEHFQVQPRPSETRWWGSGACCLATDSKPACVAAVVLCNSGFDGWM